MDVVSDFVSTDEGRKLYQRAKLEVELTELICESMEAKGVSKAELAHRLDVNPARVTEMLRDGSSMTVNSIADVFTALGLSLVLAARD